MSLSGTKTEQNLKDAFAGESQANRRYLFFAQKADVEGYNDVSAVFRSTAEGETGHAFGHLEFLTETGDPATGQPIGATADNLKAAVAGETHEYTDMYPGMARTARDEGFQVRSSIRLQHALNPRHNLHLGADIPQSIDSLGRSSFGREDQDRRLTLGTEQSRIR